MIAVRQNSFVGFFNWFLAFIVDAKDPFFCWNRNRNSIDFSIRGSFFPARPNSDKTSNWNDVFLYPHNDVPEPQYPFLFWSEKISSITFWFAINSLVFLTCASSSDLFRRSFSVQYRTDGFDSERSHSIVFTKSFLFEGLRIYSLVCELSFILQSIVYPLKFFGAIVIPSPTSEYTLPLYI